jgi:hypothetical protein
LRPGQLLRGAGRGAMAFYTSSVDAWCSLGPNGALSGPDGGAQGTMGGPNWPGQRTQDLQGRLRPPIRLYICTMGRHTVSSPDYWARPPSDTSHITVGWLEARSHGLPTRLNGLCFRQILWSAIKNCKIRLG